MASSEKMSSLMGYISIFLPVLLAALTTIQAISESEIDKLLETKFEKSIKDKEIRGKFVYVLKNYPFAGYTVLRHKVDDVLEAVAKEHKEKKGASRASLPDLPKGNHQITNNTHNNNMNANCDCSCKITGNAGACQVPICPPVPEKKDECAGAPLCDPLCAPDIIITGKDADKKIKVQPRVNNATFIFASLVGNLTSNKKLKSDIVGLFGTDLDALTDMDKSVRTQLFTNMVDIMKHLKLPMPSEIEKLFMDEKKRDRRSSNPYQPFIHKAEAFKSGADAVSSGLGAVGAFANVVQSILGLCGLSSGKSEPPSINQTINMSMKNYVNVDFRADCNCKNKCVQWHAMKRCETTCPNNPKCDKWRCVCS